MNTLKYLLALAGFMFGMLLFVPADAAEEAPDALVKRVTEEVMQTVRNDKSVKAGDRQRIETLVRSKILPHIDFRRTTMLTMGRYWRQATPEQQQKIAKEFQDLLIHTYAGALSQVGEQKLVYKPLRADPSDTDVVVRCEVPQTRGREPVQFSYRMSKTPDGWKVYDLNVLGVWLVETYKSTFADHIGREGIEGLVTLLEEKNRALLAQPAGQKVPPPDRAL